MFLKREKEDKPCEENACNSVSIDVVELRFWLSMVLFLSHTHYIFHFSLYFFFEWFVHKQIIFTQKKKSKTYYEKRTCLTHSPIQVKLVSRSTALHISFFIWIFFSSIFSFWWKWKADEEAGEEFYKAFRSIKILNANVTAYDIDGWSWSNRNTHNQRQKEWEKHKRKKINIDDVSHTCTGIEFFVSFLHSIHIILFRCIDESERTVCNIWLAHS